jgi:hypothetical protein
VEEEGEAGVSHSASASNKWNFLDFRNGSQANILAPAANNSFEDYSVRNNCPLLSHLYHENDHFYQNRLGTDLGEVEGKGVVVQAFVFAEEAGRVAAEHKALHADAPLFLYMAMQVSIPLAVSRSQ